MSKKKQLVLLYFIHPETKGRARMRIPASKAQVIRAIFLTQGYQEVSAEEYRRFTRRWPLGKLDEEVPHDNDA